MRRKIIKQRDSYTITLPMKWVKENNVDKSQEIEAKLIGNQLILSTDFRKDVRKIELNISDFDRSSLLKLLISLYERGYDEILLKFDKDEFMDYKYGKKVKVSDYIQEYARRLIGIEIVSHDKDYYLLKDVAVESEKELDNMLKRTFFLLLEFQDMLKKAIETKDISFIEDSFERHENIHKFTSFCNRALSRTFFDDSNLKLDLFYLVSTLDRLADITRYCCDDARELKKLSSNIPLIIEQINFQFRQFYELYYSESKEKSSNLIKKMTRSRFELKKTIEGLSRIPPAEVVLITRYSSILEFIYGLIKIKIVDSLK